MKKLNALKVIKEWENDNKKKAYSLYLEDSYSLKRDYNDFCSHMPQVIEHHKEQKRAEKAHAGLIYD